MTKNNEFKLEIKETDDILTKCVKQVMIDKNITTEGINVQVDSAYDLYNLLYRIQKGKHMSTKTFEKWKNILQFDVDINVTYPESLKTNDGVSEPTKCVDKKIDSDGDYKPTREMPRAEKINVIGLDLSELNDCIVTIDSKLTDKFGNDLIINDVKKIRNSHGLYGKNIDDSDKRIDITKKLMSQFKETMFQNMSLSKKGIQDFDGPTLINLNACEVSLADMLRMKKDNKVVGTSDKIVESGDQNCSNILEYNIHDIYIRSLKVFANLQSHIMKAYNTMFFSTAIDLGVDLASDSTINKCIEIYIRPINKKAYLSLKSTEYITGSHGIKFNFEMSIPNEDSVGRTCVEFSVDDNNGTNYISRKLIDKAVDQLIELMG